jgi:ribose 5-phosphate isomerase B
MALFPATEMTFAVGGDHAGFPLKRVVTQLLGEHHVKLIDCGCHSEASTDYPDFALAVGREIASGAAQRGILVCGSGVGVSVAANKLPGIRAAVCHDTYTAHQGVEHDDMNVLCIGARVIGSELALEIIRAFVSARYTPLQRHARRLEKVMRIEQFGFDA